MITLPDGTQVDLKEYIIQATEGIFNPKVIGKRMPGAHSLVWESVGKSEVAIRKELLQNIIVSGGNSCFLNFNDRIQKELYLLASSTQNVKCLNF